jgi:tetratricopeptide (TPR) repeat protein
MNLRRYTQSPRYEGQFLVAYIALAKLHLGAYEEALDSYRRSNELNPNYATGRFNMAGTPMELGRLDEARAEVKAALTLNPGVTIRWRAKRQSRFPEAASGSSKTCARPGCRRNHPAALLVAGLLQRFRSGRLEQCACRKDARRYILGRRVRQMTG